MQYRADIQGLRAIAVLGVFLFHLGVNGVPGGYVGVDIFFVISGFLITSIIAKDIRAGRFSFAQFYSRRMKRILPAVQLVGLATLLAGWYLLLPTSLLMLVKSLIASSLFASNIYFWQATTGYFGADSDELPLLHNWSLSVEEQFYMFWPLALVLLFKVVEDRRLRLVVGVVAACSFLLAELSLDYKVTAAYFLLPTRAGEFLLGALLVFVPQAGWHSKPAVSEMLAWIGLVLLLVANFLLDRHSRFPGLNALWPCLGTALVIESGRVNQTVVKKLLGMRPLVFIGTISYSLYLWHWPPIAFLNYFDIEITGLQKFALFAAVTLVAYLSWRFVEETVRRADWSLSRTVVAFALPLLAVQLAALVQVQSQKAAFRGLDEFVALPKDCREGLTGSNYPVECRLGDVSKAPIFALWGDSFAGVLWKPVDDAAKRRRVSGYRFTLSMCPSITNVVWDDPDRVPNPDFAAQCRDYATETMNYLLSDPSVRTVVITSNYLWYLTAKNARNQPILAATQAGVSVADEFRSMLERLAVAGKRIVVVMPHPSDKKLFNAALRKAVVLGTASSVSVGGLDKHKDAITAVVESLSERIKIDRVYPDQIMCEAGNCRLFDAQGDLYLADGGHVSPKMAEAIVAQFPSDWERNEAAEIR